MRGSESFPKEETDAPTDQIRRSSRSVCAHSREAWAKRRYEAHLQASLQTWIAKRVKPTLG
ncbi:four helix bundle protein [Candidatus Pelagisphaera phototrophica]|uniref:four helix bundle protein n=1 Tax=Candidatus Pelagisphaera phototrophica TaxID=2684113 RepID=UPI0031B818A0